MNATTPIGRKLTWLSILSSGSALLAASLALFYFDLQHVRQELLVRMQTIGSIVAFNSASAVDFDDADAARTMLAALRTRPSIISAAIYVRGQLFASYARENEAPPPFSATQPLNGYRFTRDDLTVFVPIAAARRQLGTLVLRTDLQDIARTRLRYAAIVGAVAVAAVIVAILISLRLQRSISGPILELAATAAMVSNEKDFSVRAPLTRSVAEVEQLVATFNQMLAEMQRQHTELQDATTLLERRVAERTRQLEQRTAELEVQGRELAAANAELEAFSYSVSHDLRAPLRGIDGFSKALLEDYHDKLDEQGRHFLHRVRSGTQRMAALIDDMLELARVTRHVLDRRSVDLSAIARDVAAELSKNDPSRQVRIDVQDGLNALADSHLLTIVMENLLGNAWKFSRKRGDAVIEVGSTDNGEGPAFFVRDNGAGFDMQYADRLFGAFQRLHGQAEFEGTGIGLATVKRIVTRHGGRIWAESRENAGATFFFTLGEDS